MGDVYPGLKPVKWNEHEQKSAVVQILCQKGDTLVNVEIQKLTDVDRRRVAELRKLLKETLPTINYSFAAIFGGFAPSFKVRKSRNLLLGNRLRYGDGGEVRKDLSWYNKTFVTLGLHLYFTPIRQ